MVKNRGVPMCLLSSTRPYSGGRQQRVASEQVGRKGEKAM